MYSLQPRRGIVEHVVDKSLPAVGRGYVGIPELLLDGYEGVQCHFHTRQSRQNAVGGIAFAEIEVEYAAVEAPAYDQELIAPIPVGPLEVGTRGDSEPVTADAACEQVGALRLGLGDVAEQIIGRVMFRENMVVLAEHYPVVPRFLGNAYHLYETFPDARRAVGVLHGIYDADIEFGFVVELRLHASPSVGAAFQIDYVGR